MWELNRYRRQTTDDRRQTTDDGRRTTDDGQHTLNLYYYSENYWRDTSIVFNLGINTTLSRSGFKILRIFVPHEIWPDTTNFCGTEYRSTT